MLYAEASLALVRGCYDVAEAKIGKLHEGFRRARPFVADTTRAALLATELRQLVKLAPLPLKAVWWATRGRFRRLETAFSGVAIDLGDLAPLAPA